MIPADLGLKGRTTVIHTQEVNCFYPVNRCWTLAVSGTVVGTGDTALNKAGDGNPVEPVFCRGGDTDNRQGHRVIPGSGGRYEDKYSRILGRRL